MKDNHRSGRFRFKVGLRGQQVVLFLLVALMPLFVVSIAIKVLGENALKGTVGENHVLLAQEKLARMDNAISEKIAKIRGELPNITEAVMHSNTVDGDVVVYFNVWISLFDSIRLLETYAGNRRRGKKKEVTITNASGYVLRSNDQMLDYNTIKEIPERVDNEIWWKNAYNNGIGYPFAENIRYDTVREVHLLPIALPIRVGRRDRRTTGENNTIGVLRIELLLPELKSIVESSVELEQTHTVLTDASGRVIAASTGSGYQIDDDIEMNNASVEAIIEAKKGRTGKYYDYEPVGENDAFNESRVYGWARTQLSPRQPWKVQQNFSNWIVFVSRPTSSAYVGVRKLNNYIFYVTIASSCIVIFVAWWAAQRIATPILRVAEAARSIGQGEFDSEIVVDSDDEVGTLAEEFNEMRRNLKTAVGQLTQEERKLTTIVDNLGEGLVVVEPTGYVLYVNPVAERLLNLGETSGFNYITLDTEAGEIRWTNAAGETGAEEITDTRTADLKILSASQRETAQHQTMIAEISVDGDLPGSSKHRILRIIASHFPDESGNVAGTVYVFDDVTNEHEIEQMKSEFVSLVSHELRTPLTSIIGFISLILDGKTGEINYKQQESLSRALRQSERLAELINDLLDISRIEAGRIEMKQEQVQIDAIAEGRIEELRPQADEKTIALLLETPPNLPVMIGDADRIGQVFINLIGNAIKYTPDNGKVTVRISKSSEKSSSQIESVTPSETSLPKVSENRKPIDSERNGFHVEVIDTGPGIPAAEREKVFDKFRQLGSVQTRQQGGSGLGLSIASGIVEAHGGKLWVDTGDNGQGSNFQFFIPIDKPSVD